MLNKRPRPLGTDENEVVINLRLNPETNQYELDDVAAMSKSAFINPRKRFKKSHDDYSETQVIHGPTTKFYNENSQNEASKNNKSENQMDDSRNENSVDKQLDEEERQLIEAARQKEIME